MNRIDVLMDEAVLVETQGHLLTLWNACVQSHSSDLAKTRAALQKIEAALDAIEVDLINIRKNLELVHE